MRSSVLSDGNQQIADARSHERSEASVFLLNSLYMSRGRIWRESAALKIIIHEYAKVRKAVLRGAAH